MSCKKKIKNTCGTRTPSSCVFHDITVPPFSHLIDEECVTVEETTKDLYDLIESVRQSIDLSGFDKGCLEIVQTKDTYTEENVFLVKDILTALKNSKCSTESEENSNNMEFILNNLDYKCLVLPCDAKPKNLFQFLQILINKVCNG